MTGCFKILTSDYSWQGLKRRRSLGGGMNFSFGHGDVRVTGCGRYVFWDLKGALIRV